MKIAIIAPSSIPFTVGGAEKLWWGMLEYINKHTTHQCELIKVPTKENDFWNLIDSYNIFYKLDLSYFDMVISTKYPAWMIQHPNHHIYLQHCLRGLYDTYCFTGLPTEYLTNHIGVNYVLKLMKKKDIQIEEIFEALYKLKKDNSVPKDTYTFPGPFIRQLIHFLDNKTMQKVKIFSAISQTVIDRKEYFPKNININKIYHPSNLSKFENKSSEFFFTVSRLDDSKRIQIIVDSYMKTMTKIPLKIAGTGPLTDKLMKIIKDDSRIELLGFVSDDDLIKYYSKSYAVIFIPYEEDYGLITIEAMMCEKPVLTFSDAGGVLEFVEDKITGLVCEANIEALVNNIDFISNNPLLCEKMGKEAKKRVENITWKNTLDTLLNEEFDKKITVITTYAIYPPRSGGQNRIFYLYKELAKSMIVDILCLVHEDEEFKKTEIAPNLFEFRVPKTQQHAKKERKIEEKAGVSITDIAMLYLYNETPLFVDEVKKSCLTSSLVIMSQPYTYMLLQEHINLPIIYESHNIEYSLKKQMLKDTSYNKKLLDKLFTVEKDACQNGLHTLVCAMDDAFSMQDLYGLHTDKTILVPNGVDLESVPYISAKKRRSLKESLGLGDQKIVLFIGSSHQPNIDSVEEILKMAVKLPDYYFIVMGSVGEYFAFSSIPNNIGFTGVIDNMEKEIYLSVVDIAINPMLTGSGTTLKMLDYMANGIPVLSTEVGARGLNIPKGYIGVCDITEFCEYVLNIDRCVDVEKSRIYVEENFSWKIIQEKLKEIL